MPDTMKAKYIAACCQLFMLSGLNLPFGRSMYLCASERQNFLQLGEDQAESAPTHRQSAHVQPVDCPAPQLAIDAYEGEEYFDDRFKRPRHAKTAAGTRTCSDTDSWGR